MLIHYLIFIISYFYKVATITFILLFSLHIEFSSVTYKRIQQLAVIRHCNNIICQLVFTNSLNVSL